MQSFPPGAGKFQVSTAGGSMPRWRRNGKELFFMSLTGKLMAVDVKMAPKFESGVPRELFQTQMQGAAFSVIYNYDVAADGKRFLIQTPIQGQQSVSPPITVVLNWQAGLKK